MRIRIPRSYILGNAIVLGVFLISSPAYAYIDPNAGGMLFQILMPIFLIISSGFFWLRRRLMNAFQWFLPKKVVELFRKLKGDV